MRISFLVTVFVLISSISFLMAEKSNKSAGESIPGSGEDGAVHIVYLDRPEGEDPEAFHIRTLASVVGGEDAAKEALIYHYKHAASGFSAKLTPQQVAELSLNGPACNVKGWLYSIWTKAKKDSQVLVMVYKIGKSVLKTFQNAASTWTT